jgi:hypothetical protein
MSFPLIGKEQVRELTHAYVALALARDVAQRNATEQPDRESLRALLTTLNVATESFEEIMRKALPEEVVPELSETLCSDTVM